MNVRLPWILLGACAMLNFSPVRAGDAPEPLAAGTNAALTLTRDPFWPVDWEPPQLGKVSTNRPATNTVLTEWDKARASLQVTGLSKGKDGKYLAVLKGIGVVEEGDTVSVNLVGLNYRWKIVSITVNGIVPERVGVYPIK